ncbi:MAG: hypothetical protein IKW51_04570, partial [Bacteroidales bacterium]|nr:hypothetical protein [Bacteroidales bacterium]
LCTMPEPVEGTTSGASTSSATSFPRTVDRCPLSVDFNCAKAHYYHAVGLTEKDDIVGACEHYLIALEIMEEMMANDKRLKAKGKKSTDNPEDYEMIRFVALIYSRLGRLFYNESYCDLSMLKYKKALDFIELIKDTAFKANVLKELGNVYQLNGKSDSALLYYNSSLEMNPALANRIDLEKNIAKILFDKGEKDSAYNIIKTNIDRIVNTNLRHSYYNILGDMYMEDKEYDSAIYYFDKSINSNISSIKITASIKLSAIYASTDDYEKKAYYDEIISRISINDVNKNLKNNQLQDVYDKYKERKVEKEKLIGRTRTKVIAISLSALVFVAFIIIILIWYKSKRKDKYIAIKEKKIDEISKEIEYKESEIKKLVEITEHNKSDIETLKNELLTKEQELSYKNADIKKIENDLLARERDLKRLKNNVDENETRINIINKDNKNKEELIIAYIEEIEKLKTEIDETRHNLNDIKFRSSLIEGKIKSKNIELQKKKEEINKYKLELSEFKNKLDIIRSNNNDNTYTTNAGMESYLKSKVCSKILNEINDLYARNRDTNNLTPLKPEELVMLLNSASLYVNNFTNGIACKYSKLKKEDLYYLSLAIIDLKDKQISSLLGVTYNSIRIRKKNVCSILGIKNNELHSFLMNIYNQ